MRQSPDVTVGIHVWKYLTVNYRRNEYTRRAKGHNHVFLKRFVKCRPEVNAYSMVCGLFDQPSVLGLI